MENISLNRLAWGKLKQDKLAFPSLVFIIVCFLIAIFAPIFSPDSSIHANEMHIELAVMDPMSKVLFLEISSKDSTSSSFVKSIFFGSTSQFRSIAIDDFNIINNGIEYYPYGSGVQKRYIGEYNVSENFFWFGTDRYGRDLLSRIFYGARISLSVGFISVFISLIIGITLGLLAGFFRGRTDDIIMWFVNVIWSIPSLLMVIAITLALGKGFWQVFIAVGLTMWVEVARIVRGQVLFIRELEYVEAGRALAYRSSRIIFRHILPNVLGPVIVISSANFAAAILIEAGLSFLGIGAQPPIPSWGGMIKDHYSYIIMDKAFLAIIPGLAIMSLVLSFMLLGNGLRDAFDVKN